MSYPESGFSVNVDVTNPGQFFACCGLLELAHRLWPGVEGWFCDAHFSLAAPHRVNARLVDLLTALLDCDVEVVTEGVSDLKTAPLKLGPPLFMRLDWWLNEDGEPNLFKTWAANATSKQMFCKWRNPLRASPTALADNPAAAFQVSTRLQGSYGFDSELGWDALTVGFSLNEHSGLKELPTRPVVELVGAIGLQRFFPILDRKQQRVSYWTWSAPLSAPVARVAAIGRIQITGGRRLRTRFVYRGSFKGLDTATVIHGASDE